MNVLLVGTGKMARAYAKVLSAQKIPTRAIGRAEEHAKKFSEETGIETRVGDIEKYLQETSATPERAIVAVNVGALAEVALALIRAGAKNVLLEKPGGATPEAIRAVAKEAETLKTSVILAYNRRFYASALKAEEFIREDGGVKECAFDFTERLSVLDLPLSPLLKRNWFLANSTHLVDLAFFLAGKPKTLDARTDVGERWQQPSIFSGNGTTERGAAFSYSSNWEKEGRWRVEIKTHKRELLFMPLEKLQERREGQWREISLDDALDVEYKPGIYREVQAFMREDRARFPTIGDQAEMLPWYEKIGGLSL